MIRRMITRIVIAKLMTVGMKIARRGFGKVKSSRAKAKSGRDKPLIEKPEMTAANKPGVTDKTGR